MFLCTTVVRDTAGEVGVTGGTPMLQVIFLLSGKTRINITKTLKQSPVFIFKQFVLFVFKQGSNLNTPIFVCSLKRLLHSGQQGDQTCVAHVLDLHHPLLVRNAVHVTPEVLLKKTRGGEIV